jgi:guanine nucleotide-binding protein G(I)/G(S)/G(T) subunit beta-1
LVVVILIKVWNAHTTNKIYAIPLRTSWMMTCAYAPSGALVACGGLDNVVSVFRVPPADPARPEKLAAELVHHEGYLSCARFVDDREVTPTAAVAAARCPLISSHLISSHVVSCRGVVWCCSHSTPIQCHAMPCHQMLTSSGDGTCVLWDLTTQQPKSTFGDHTGDVMSVAVDTGKHWFVSGSCDATCKLWDYRVGKSMATFRGHESDINGVTMFPDGTCRAARLCCAVLCCAVLTGGGGGGVAGGGRQRVRFG